MSEDTPASPALSKRAARRLIQRAFVLLGRERHIRQRLREARLLTLWVIEDWEFAWTVEFDRGKVRFERRAPRRPAVTLTWRDAAAFFGESETGKSAEAGFEVQGDLEDRKFLEPVQRAFRKLMKEVMQNPVDDAGTRLV